MRSRVRSVPEYLAVRTFPSVEAVRNAYDWDVAICAGRYSHWRNLRFSKGAYIVLVRALDLEQAMELQQRILDRFQHCNVIFQSETEKCCRSRNNKLNFVYPN